MKPMEVIESIVYWPISFYQLMNILDLGWWISEHYVDKFLTTEAERIERKLFQV